MGRILLIVLLAVVLAGAAGWYFELFTHPSDNRDGDSQMQSVPVDPKSLGEWLYKPAPAHPGKAFHQIKGGRDPVAITGTTTEIDKLDVPSNNGGEVLYIGDGVPEGVTQLAGVAPFMQRNYQQADVTQGGRKIVKFYRPLSKGAEVVGGQLVGELNFARALNNFASKSAKVIQGIEEVKVNKDTLIEANRRLDTELRIKSSEKEIADARLTVMHQKKELVKSEQELEVAKLDVDSAKILLELHEIRPNRPFQHGYIKTVYKDTGEAVKELEPVLHIYSIDRLMAEAFVDAQLLSRVPVGAALSATIEPAQDEMPLRMFEGHRKPITGVSFIQAGDTLYVASVSEDGYLKLWDKNTKGAIVSIDVAEPLRAMACSPCGAARPLCLAGTAEGKIHLWRLVPDKDGRPNPTAVIDKPLEAHRDAITALAFSPDGAYFASGAADGSIKLWRAEDGKPIYAFEHSTGADNTHQGAITSLSFTPQCQLISASRDNTLRVWNLKERGAYLQGRPITGRSGNVSQLGVSQDGRWMLFDQGKSLQLMTAPDGHVVNTLKNPGGASPFETLALFSSDGALILTGGAPEGRLQLWRAPSEATRGFEVRQFATEQRSAVTCAAFAPATGGAGETAFAVSGTRDGFVYLWPVPSKQEADNHPIPNVPVRLSRSVEAGSRQIRILVEVPNPTGRLIPGRTVTIVME
jgi:WD40 repeat protein